MVFIAVVVGIVFFVGREIVLATAVSQVRSSLSTLRRTAQNTGSYAQQCRELGVTDQDTAPIAGVQLRFTSPTTYVLEVVCNTPGIQPIQFQEHTLPFMVQKTAGSSGLYWSDQLSGIGLEVLGRSRGIFVEEGRVWIDAAEKSVGLAGPVTTCQGHGFDCCQEQLTQGSGTQITQVTDCPRSCFEICETRPVLLSLSTQPFYEGENREVAISSGESLEIGFLIDPQGASEVQTTVDFGDGSSQVISELQGRLSHVYTCAQARCRYQLIVSAVNQKGIQSAETSIGSVWVVVNRQ